jgi:branched-subunit amino acid ABC-type transport system permease component
MGCIQVLTEIIVIVIAILSIFFLRLFLNQTKNGKAFRAMSFNVELAMVRGIDTNFMSNIIWFIASGLAGLSGVLLGLTAFISSDMGWNQSLIIMSAAIFGGIGSIYGVMIGSLVMGLAMELGVMVLPSGYKPAIAFLIIIIMLFIKPEGVFRGGQ